MANKYSRYELQPYVSQYVDPQKATIASLLRDRYDKNRAQYDMLVRTAASQKTIGDDNLLVDAALQDINTKFENTISSGNFENAGGVISMATNDFIQNPGLKAAQESYTRFKKEEEINDNLRSQGKKIILDKVYQRDEEGNVMYDEMNNPIMVPKSQHHRSYYQDETTGETVTNIYEPTSEMMLDYDSQMQELMQNIASDPIMLRKLGITESDVRGYLAYGEAVGPEKVKQVSEAMLQVYLTSQEGEQQLRYLTEGKINSLTGNTFNQEEAVGEIHNQLLAIGKKQIGAKITGYLEDKQYWLDQKRKEQQGIVPLKLSTYTRNVQEGAKNWTALDSLKTTDNDGREILDNKYFDSNGNYDWGGSVIFGSDLGQDDLEDVLTAIQSDLDYFIEEAGGDIRDVEEEILEANMDAYMAHLLINNKDARYMQHNGEAVFKNDKEFFDAVLQAETSWEEYVDTVWYPNMEYNEYVASAVAGKAFHAGGQWSIFDPDSGEYTKSLSEFLEVASDEYGVDSEDIENAMQDAKNIKVGGILPTGVNPGSFLVYIDIPDEGVSIPVELGGHKEMQATFTNSHAIVDDLRNHRFDNEITLNPFPVDLNGDGQYDAISSSVIDYRIDPNQKVYVPALTQTFYSLDSIGFDGKISQNATTLTHPYYGTNSVLTMGNQVISMIAEQEMNAFMRSDMYMQYANAKKGDLPK